MSAVNRFDAFAQATRSRLGRDVLSAIRREMRFTREELAYEFRRLLAMIHISEVDEKSRLDEITEGIETKKRCMRVLAESFPLELLLYIRYEQELSSLERAYQTESAEFRRRIHGLRRQAIKVRAECVRSTRS
jgi:hypothetical protein